MHRCGLYGRALAFFVLCAIPLGQRVQAADAPTVAREDRQASFKPGVLIRLESIDDLVADARFLAKEADREELARQAARMLKARTGPKGLEGIDTTRPIGLYGTLAARIDRSEAVLLLPIADESAFLAFLKNLDYTPEKDKTGLYTLTIEGGPYPILFRFANGYLYATLKLTDKNSLAADKLPMPASVLSGGAGLLSVTANIDRIPVPMRKIAISAAALTLGNLKEEKPKNETAAEYELRAGVLDEAAVQVKSLLEDGGAVMLKIDVDRKKHDLSLSLSMDARPDSALAKTLLSLGAEKSLAAALSDSHSALGGFVHATLPAGVRKLLGPVVDEHVNKALGNLQEDARALLTPLIAALKPSLKDGTLDLGVNLRGPGKSGKYTLVGAVQLKDGEAIDKAGQKVVEKLPEAAGKPFSLNIDKANGVGIHRIEPNDVGRVAKELFGDGTTYFAFRKDALLFASGDNALETLKSCLTVEPKAGKLLQVDLSLARIARLLAVQHKTAPEAAKKVFAEKGSDKVRLSLEAGGKLELKLSIKTPALTFAALLDKARKQAEKEKEQ